MNGYEEINGVRLSVKLNPSGFSLLLDSESEFGFAISFFATGSHAYQLSSSVEGYLSEKVVNVTLPFSPLRVGITSLELRPFEAGDHKGKRGKKAARREVHLRYAEPLQMLPVYAGQGSGRGRRSRAGYSRYSGYSAYSRYSHGARGLEILPPVMVDRLDRQRIKPKKKGRKSRKTQRAQRNKNNKKK